jgi:hypothetical protein
MGVNPNPNTPCVFLLTPLCGCLLAAVTGGRTLRAQRHESVNPATGTPDTVDGNVKRCMWFLPSLVASLHYSQCWGYSGVREAAPAAVKVPADASMWVLLAARKAAETKHVQMHTVVDTLSGAVSTVTGYQRAGVWALPSLVATCSTRRAGVIPGQGLLTTLQGGGCCSHQA